MATPAGDAWLKGQVAKYVQQYAPRIAQILGLPSIIGQSPVEIRIVPTPEQGWAAWTYIQDGRVILSVSSDYFLANRDQIPGAIAHELSHATIGSPSGAITSPDAGRAAIAFSEGMADYVRDKLGLPAQGTPWRPGEGRPIKNGYQDAAAFIHWIDKQYPRTAQKIAESLAQGTFQPAVVEQITGQRLGQLVQEYQSTGGRLPVLDQPAPSQPSPSQPSPGPSPGPPAFPGQPNQPAQPNPTQPTQPSYPTNPNQPGGPGGPGSAQQAPGGGPVGLPGSGGDNPPKPPDGGPPKFPGDNPPGGGGPIDWKSENAREAENAAEAAAKKQAALEQSYKDVANKLGYTLSPTIINALVQGRVSAQELADRLLAVQRIVRAPGVWGAFQATLNQYGIKNVGRDGLMAFALGEAPAEWYKIWENASIRSTARNYGVNLGNKMISRVMKEESGQISAASGAKGISQLTTSVADLASQIRATIPLSKIYQFGLTKSDLIAAEFGGPGAQFAKEKIQRVADTSAEFWSVGRAHAGAQFGQQGLQTVGGQAEEAQVQ